MFIFFLNFYTGSGFIQSVLNAILRITKIFTALVYIFISKKLCDLTYQHIMGSVYVIGKLNKFHLDENLARVFSNC